MSAPVDFTSIEHYLAAIETLATELGKARAAEIELADARAIEKPRAIERIMAAAPDSLTGKAHSYTSAERLCETDPTFAAIRKQQGDNLLLQEVLRGKLEAAKLRARVMLEALG